MSDAVKIVLALGIGGAAAYAITQLVAKKKAPRTSADRCAQFAPLGAEAVLACRAAGLIQSLIPKQESTSDVDAVNAQLNGPIVKRDPLGMATSGYFAANQDKIRVTEGSHVGEWVEMLKGRKPVPQHQNGCIPYRSVTPGNPSELAQAHRGTCQPGTRGYFWSGALGAEFKGPVQKTKDGLTYTLQFTGDPLTHPHFSKQHVAKMEPVGNKGQVVKTFREVLVPFPKECPAGTTPWWVSGNPVCKGPQEVVAIRHDADNSYRSVIHHYVPTDPFAWDRSPTVWAHETQRKPLEANGGCTQPWTKARGKVDESPWMCVR